MPVVAGPCDVSSSFFPDERVILVAMGGVPLVTEAYASWPRQDGTHWIIQAKELPDRPDMTPLAEVDMSSIDLLCSCDALVSKLGYSYPVECGCNGIPLLYIERPEWPETSHGRAWVERHCVSAPIDRKAFESGAFMAELDGLLAMPKPPRPKPSGVAQATDLLMGYLGRD